MPPKQNKIGSVVLNTPIDIIRGIGPKKLEAFKKLGIEVLEDLFYFLPRRYEDRREPVPLRDLQIGEYNCAIAKVTDVTCEFGRTNAVIFDGRSYASVVWFSEKLSFVRPNMILALYGMVDNFGGQAAFSHPKFEILRYKNQSTLIGKIFPVYPATAELSQKEISGAVDYALENFLYLLQEFLPEKIIKHHGLMSYPEAIINIHNPIDEDNFLRARNRLAFDELFLLQTGIFMRRQRNLKPGAKILQAGKLHNAFMESLPFKITRAQNRAIQEILKDVGTSWPMNRLLQGDVGSGKTLVAISAMLTAVDSGAQAVFMCPTEILAQQHYITLKKFLASLNIKIALLTGSTKLSERKKILSGLKKGTINILVGTHAVFSDDVKFDNPALFVIDEQHKFGVLQRNALISKSEAPHVLAMTATPIPRTLILSIYGDLDVSVLDELPPNRKHIETIAMQPVEFDILPRMIRQRVRSHEQIYWVCPLIEEGERALSNVTNTFERLKRILPDIKIAMLHGRMSIEEKSEVMQEFSEGHINLLVATTVIEVGVDVPNASLMIIQDAGQFGLAQLHQLRGRIGRGNVKSTCILMESQNITDEGEARIMAMVENSDGFQLAEQDLMQRGPGALCGVRQHGVTDFYVADLVRDKRILNLARRDAEILIKNDPELESEPLLKNELMRRLGEALELIITS